MGASFLKSIRIRAHAKLNLTLRVLGTRPDGYHELRTTFQSLLLHDTLTVRPVSGPFGIDCDDPACPADDSNLIWKAAELLWRQLGNGGAISGSRIAITKRIPMQAGLGGGSSDAAAALVALAMAWRAPHTDRELRRLSGELGADVPYFFEGGTALGLERGDLIIPLSDCQPFWVVLALPAFGVSTRDAYAWWDTAFKLAADKPRRSRRSVSGPFLPGPAIPGLALPDSEIVNDLQDPVVAHHSEVGRLVRRLQRLGASYAAMSGSGSAVFGLFSTERQAAAASSALARPRLRVVMSRTVGRTPYRRHSAPRVF